MPYAPRRIPALPAAASALLVASIGWLLVAGLRVDLRAAIAPALVAVDMAAPSPTPTPSPPPPRPEAASAPKGAPSPENLRNRATQIVAPVPRLPQLIVPPPVVVAPVSGTGSAAQNGASDRAGPGQGAGGLGNGLGGGGLGGDGDGRGIGRPPRQIKGKLSFKDLPEGVLAPGQEASADVRYRVNEDGSVSGCRIDRSSGYPSLDTLACRLIEQRFRFRPARDRANRPVASVIVESHTWVAASEN